MSSLLKPQEEQAGSHALESSIVEAPVIEEYPLTLECKDVSIEGGSEMYGVVEVLNIKADESVLGDAGRVDFSRLKPLSVAFPARAYRVLGTTVGTAFEEGKDLL